MYLWKHTMTELFGQLTFVAYRNMCVYMHMYVYACVYIYICVYMCMYIKT